jgi:hypothetical protein
MSQFGQRVVAVIDTASTFGTTVNQLKNNVETLQTQMSTLLADAPETLDTLNEIAAAISDDPAFFSTMSSANTTLQNNIDTETTNRTTVVAALQALIDAATTARGLLSGRLDTLEADATTGTALAAVQADVDANEADHDAAIALKFDKTGGQITGNLAIAKSFPDVELKAGDEKRILFADAGGAATAALKHVSGSLDFYVGGIASGNKEMSLDTDGLDVTALKIDGTAVSATAAEINAHEGRLDTLEADPTTATALAAVQSDVDANEAASDAAEAALSGRLDTLEADPVTKTYVDTQVTNVIDAAPGALDTLNELAAALGDDANFATTITNSIAAVQADVNQNETDADAAIAAVQVDVDANEADRKTYFKWDSNLTKVVNPLRSSEIEIGNNIHIDPAAGYATQFDGNVEFDNNTVLSHGGTDLTATFAEINAFDGRLDTLEADPTTAAAVAAVQADVDQNETDADAALANLSTNLNNEGAVRLLADNALSGRLDTLEADPTTATALAAVQADVDQNESDADAAIALKAPLASPAFTGDVNFDSGAMFFKQSSGRLGLGTTNPGDSVHVHGGLIVQRSGGSSKIYLKQNTTDDGMTIQGQSNSANSIVLDTVGGSAGVKFTNNDHGTLATIGSTISLNKDVTMKLTSSVTPSANSDMMIEATNNTTLTFKLKGSDGTVRSGTLTLS